MITQQAGNLIGWPRTERIRREREQALEFGPVEGKRSTRTVLVQRVRRRRDREQGFERTSNAQEQRFNRTAGERRQALDVAFSDNSRELQARFLAEHGPPPEPRTFPGRLAWVRDNLKQMLRDELSQWSRESPYRRSDYRAVIAALEGLTGQPPEPSPPPLSGPALEQAMHRLDETWRRVDGYEALGQSVTLVA